MSTFFPFNRNSPSIYSMPYNSVSRHRFQFAESHFKCFVILMIVASHASCKKISLAIRKKDICIGFRADILPKRNAKDVSELPAVVRAEMELIQVATLDEVLDHALLTPGQRTLHVA